MSSNKRKDGEFVKMVGLVQRAWKCPPAWVSWRLTRCVCTQTEMTTKGSSKKAKANPDERLRCLTLNSQTDNERIRCAGGVQPAALGSVVS